MTGGERARGSSSPAAPGSSARTSARRCSTGATRSSPSTTWSPGGSQNIEHLFGRDGFTFPHHDVSNYVRVAGPVDAVLHFASPASPKDYLELPIQTLKVGSLGTHNCLGLAKDKGARFFLASTSEVYGDPQVHPQPESYWGNVNPVGPRGVYDEAKRFAEAMTMAYHRHHGARRAHRPHLQHLRPPHAARPTGGWCRTSSSRRCTASRSRSTATAARPAASATSTTRCAASSPCSTRDHVGPGQHRQPQRVHHPRAGRAGPRGHRLDVRDRLRAAARRRPDPAPARHHAWPAACSAGSPASSSARASPAPPSGWRGGHDGVTRPARDDVAAVVVSYNVRDLLLRVPRAACGPTASSASSSSTTPRPTARSAAVAADARRRPRRPSSATSASPAAPTGAWPAPTRPTCPGQPRRGRRARLHGRRWSRPSSATPGWRSSGPASTPPTAGSTRRPGASPTWSTPPATPSSTSCWPRQPVQPPLPDARLGPRHGPATSTGWPAPTSSCAGRRGTRSAASTSGYFMYMEDVDLCWRLRPGGLAGRATSRPPGSSTRSGAPPTRPRTG